MINKSFSKGDMLELISLFGLDIPNAKTMDKLKLSIILWSGGYCLLYKRIHCREKYIWNT